MKIILSAIVGNEEAVIERFIRSFAPTVDGFVFVRAIGNQEPDATSDIIRKVCGELKKSVIESQYNNTEDLSHVDDFGSARQHSLDIAKKGLSEGDFILWADADDVLADGAAEAILTAAESGKCDTYLMPYHVNGDKQVVWRERLIRADIGAKWNHAIHESLSFPRDVSYRMIKGAIFIHSPLDTKTRSHERNLAILRAELKDAPRNLFYLAQEYFQNGLLDQFKPIAESILILPGLGDIERYEILMQLAQTPGTPSKKLAAEAYATMPDRREALALLVNYAIIDGEHERALELAEAMTALGRPKKTYWSQNNEWYGWKAAELYRQCLRLNDREEEAQNDWDFSTTLGKPKFSVIYKATGSPEIDLAIRDTWLSSSDHPENADFIFDIEPDDERTQNVLKGFPKDPKNPLGDHVINAINIPIQGWDQDFVEEPKGELQTV